MFEPQMQSLLENVYQIEEHIITEGLFTVLGRDRRQLVMMAIGETHLFTFHLKSVKLGTEFELFTMEELDKVQITAHHQSMRLGVVAKYYEEYYQLCSKANTQDVWNNFIRGLKQHGTEYRWIHEAMKFPKEHTKGKITYDPYYVSFLNDALREANERYIKIHLDRFKPTFTTMSNLRRCVSLSSILPSGQIPHSYYFPIKQAEMEPRIKYGPYTLEAMKQKYWFQIDEEKPVDPIIAYYNQNSSSVTIDESQDALHGALELEHDTDERETDKNDEKTKSKAKKTGIITKILKAVFPCFYKSKTKE